MTSPAHSSPLPSRLRQKRERHVVKEATKHEGKRRWQILLDSRVSRQCLHQEYVLRQPQQDWRETGSGNKVTNLRGRDQSNAIKCYDDCFTCSEVLNVPFYFLGWAVLTALVAENFTHRAAALDLPLILLVDKEHSAWENHSFFRMPSQHTTLFSLDITR